MLANDQNWYDRYRGSKYVLRPTLSAKEKAPLVGVFSLADREVKRNRAPKAQGSHSPAPYGSRVQTTMGNNSKKFFQEITLILYWYSDHLEDEYPSMLSSNELELT